MALRGLAELEMVSIYRKWSWSLFSRVSVSTSKCFVLVSILMLQPWSGGQYGHDDTYGGG